MLLAAACAVVAILFTSGANSTVDGSELDARITGIVDQTRSTRGGIETVTEHPLYAALPIDTEPLETTVDSIEDHGVSLASSTAVSLTESGRGEITFAQPSLFRWGRKLLAPAPSLANKGQVKE